MIQVHQLKPNHKRKQKKRVGRGGKRGTYSGKGIKGQKARAGAKSQPVIRELIKRYPKKRGYKQKPTPTTKFGVEVNLDALEKKFANGEKINPKILLKRKLINKIKGKIPEIKILGKGKITKALMIEECQISKSAKEKIEKAGGKIISNFH